MGEARSRSYRDRFGDADAPTGALSAWADDLQRPVAPAVEAPGASEPFYVSADSAPAGYAVNRSAGVAPLFLAALGVASVAVASAAQPLTSAYARLLGALTGTDPAAAGATISIRPFVLVLFALLAVFAAGSRRSRLRLLATALIVYAVLGLATDVALVLARPLGAPEPLSTTGGLVAAIAALAAAVLVLFTRYTLPPGVRVPTVVQRPWPRTSLFLAVLAGAVVAAMAVGAHRGQLLDGLGLPWLATFTSSAIVLVLVLQLALFLAGSVRARPQRHDGYTPSVAFLVPAYNEERSVGAVIRALDAAAARYDGDCRLYLVDNASPDRTAERARAALEKCSALDGDVLTCRPRGKSNALNYGLVHTSEEIVIRVDADTLVPPTLLVDVVPYFSNGDVGGVSGIPLPRPDTPRMLSALRQMEVYYAVSFLRTGQNAVDATLVMPGNMSAYRGDLVRGLGGFAVGFNGEDTDIAVRIGRLGYRIVTDPKIRFLTEVPASVGHLMEQRRRWTRGIFYVAARNKSSIPQCQGLRGLALLPWSALSACRRALTIPLLICVGAAAAIDPGMVSLRQIAVVGGAIVGAHMLVVALLLVARGRIDLLPYVPAYVLFRIFKLYVAFGALLTLELKRPAAAPAQAAPAAA